MTSPLRGFCSPKCRLGPHLSSLRFSRLYDGTARRLQGRAESSERAKSCWLPFYQRFLLEYCLSDDKAIVDLARRSLQYQSDRRDRFFPRRLLPAIETRCSGDAATQFRVAMTKRVGEYVKAESNSAIRQSSLHLDLDDHRLADETSIFDGLYSIY
jgi:hypothetical protein